MIQSLAKVTKAIDQVGLAYIVGDESLLGLSENNLDQYRFNPVLFQLPVSMAWLRYIALALMLFSQGIIVKPKIVYGQFRLKIRAKLGPLKKAQNFIFLIPLKQSEDQFLSKKLDVHVISQYLQYSPLKLLCINISHCGFHII